MIKVGMLAMEPEAARAYLEDRSRADADTRARAQEGPRPSQTIYSRDGDIATIRIEGPLSVEGPDSLDIALGYGGTSYNAIIAALTKAANEPGVQSIRVFANTPGGTLDGADATYRAMARTKAAKPVHTIVSGMLASAGYYICCPSTDIRASNPTDEIGSIGVIIADWDLTGAYDQIGVKRVEIRSKNAPDKAANVSSEKGKSVLQARVDAAERVFYSRISSARGVTPDQIAERFGQGALLIAQDPGTDVSDAIRSGMIDGLVDDTLLSSSSATVFALEAKEPSVGSPAPKQYVSLAEWMATPQGRAAYEAEYNRAYDEAKREAHVEYIKQIRERCDAYSAYMAGHPDPWTAKDVAATHAILYDEDDSSGIVQALNSKASIESLADILLSTGGQL